MSCENFQSEELYTLVPSSKRHLFAIMPALHKPRRRRADSGPPAATMREKPHLDFPCTISPIQLGELNCNRGSQDCQNRQLSCEVITGYVNEKASARLSGKPKETPHIKSRVEALRTKGCSATGTKSRADFQLRQKCKKGRQGGDLQTQEPASP